MKKLPLLLAAMLVASTSAYAKTPAEREQIMHDSVRHHHVNHELRQEIRADKKELRQDKRELRKDKRALRKARRHQHHHNNK